MMLCYLTGEQFKERCHKIKERTSNLKFVDNHNMFLALNLLVNRSKKNISGRPKWMYFRLTDNICFEIVISRFL